ncbi:BREX-2 system phosphatase PglZ [Nakamurella endophytica]|uniref:PglZ domain-containing protein n=1 Tax=Nakamurella endophytica TaxID=1748367 RepID=A0A917SWN0_9ACTN|nr:BREX-2 system phosphatase PglZ [Nakamurella endophytica]GGL99845.1 hypothetical protein GCM10011594_19770 [Nakamurella endophytica]
MSPTTTTDNLAATVDRSTVIAQIRLMRRKRRRGVLAILATPVWSGTDVLEADGSTYRVWPCPSRLAVRDALRHRHETEPAPVILTDLEAAELGDGICDHLVDHRPLSPHPLSALLDLFSADRQETQLFTTTAGARSALSRLGAVQDIRPAPAGVLTRDHLFHTLVSTGFGLEEPEPSPVDVLLWSAVPDHVARFELWRRDAHPDLVAEVFGWLRPGLGRAASALTTAWSRSGPADLLPLGLVAGLTLEGAASVGQSRGESVLLGRLEERIGTELTEAATVAWAVAAADAGRRLLTGRPDDHLARDAALRRADALAVDLRAGELVRRSDVLPNALPFRLTALARAAAPALESWTPGSQIDTAALAPVEAVWDEVEQHVQVGPGDSPTQPAGARVGRALVRLLRRATVPLRPFLDIATLPVRYRDDESWIDTAVNDLFEGYDDPAMAQVVDHILGRIRLARAAQDRAAAQLIAGTAADPAVDATQNPMLVEHVLDRVVLPLTRPAADDASSVLLVVADGMSAAALHDVIADACGFGGWLEAEIAGDPGSRAALAALPTLTRLSRCSLLSGRLVAGEAADERRNFDRWLRSKALGRLSAGPTLFHKGDLEARSAGFALPEPVRAAIDDTAYRPVVACVLNTIDDALDRSDPIGTHWTTSTITHLDNLLTAAARVGRTVVLTSDHGHVVERRELGIDRSGEKTARWRSADGDGPTDREVLVQGGRVLTEAGTAILAVEEQLRYGTKKAGYHGGAALAEIVVPVAILAAGSIPPGLPLVESAGGTPEWWAGPLAPAQPLRESQAPSVRPVRSREPALFDTPATVAPERPARAAPADAVTALLRHRLFEANRARFAPTVSPERIAALLRGLIAAGGSQPRAQAAVALEVPERRLSGTLAVLGQVLNIDGVTVLSQDPTRVQLSVQRLYEQFGLR